MDFLIETYSREEGREIILVPVGPLSNVAMALKRAPRIVANIPEIVLMGGAHEMGNVTASAEFNVWADPEAAQVVFRSGVAKLTMVALDATHRAQVSREDAARLRALGTPAGTAAATFIERRVQGYMEFDRQARAAAPVHDALAVASIVNPAVITTVPAHVDVETDGALTVGRTVVDRRTRSTARAQRARGARGRRAALRADAAGDAGANGPRSLTATGRAGPRSRAAARPSPPAARPRPGP